MGDFRCFSRWRGASVRACSGWFIRPFPLAILLAAATLALYCPVHWHPFVNYDDSLYVTNNDQVQNPVGGDTVTWAFTTFDVGTWHSLTWLSHALDCELFQLNPAGHQDSNLLLHVLDVVLLFWVLLRATGYPRRSFMLAALVALHPINVESVAWIAERKNLLSMLFFLLALGAYWWYARGPRIGRRWPPPSLRVQPGRGNVMTSTASSCAPQRPILG